VPDQGSHLGELSDHDLVALAVSGDRGAFAALVGRHQARVFRLARALTDDHHEAEDVLQQTFLSAWQALGGFRGEASVRTWLLTIAKNAAWQARAKRAREPIDDVPIDDLGLLAGWGQADPETIASRAQERALLEAAFARLAPEERQVLVLRDLEGVSGEETAAAIGTSLAAMKSRLHRARLRLAAELRKGVPRVAGRA
jgi:RNA polymerase sigma-70 factor (ECF subfamily)